MKYSHHCIKCSSEYKSNEQDPYYCNPCDEQRKAIAKEVDSKLATRIPKRQVKSELQIFDELSRERGSKFINMRDLGIQI